MTKQIIPKQIYFFYKEPAYDFPVGTSQEVPVELKFCFTNGILDATCCKCTKVFFNDGGYFVPLECIESTLDTAEGLALVNNSPELFIETCYIAERNCYMVNDSMLGETVQEIQDSFANGLAKLNQ